MPVSKPTLYNYFPGKPALFAAVVASMCKRMATAIELAARDNGVNGYIVKPFAPAQLEAKVAFVRESLRRLGRIEWAGEIAIRHADEFGYRSRAEIKVARDDEATQAFLQKYVYAPATQADYLAAVGGAERILELTR